MASEAAPAKQPESAPAPSAPSVRQPDQVSLSFLAIVEVAGDKLPSRVKLRDHSLEFNESEHFPNTVITGTHGMQSKHELVVIAGEWKRRNQSKGRMALLIDAQYRVDNLKLGNKAHATWDVVKSTGWLHLDRLSSKLRKELESEWLQWIEEDLGARRAAAMSQLTLGEIALEHPRYVARLLRKTSPRLTTIIHPVRPKADPDKILWVATVRMEPERFSNLNARYMSDIEVVI